MGERLPSDRHVLRAGVRDRHGPEEPIGLDFHRSDEDKKTGRVTVWDRDRTTPEQVLSMVRHPEGRPVLDIAVSEIESRGYKKLGYGEQADMIVVRDPLPCEDRKKPGADGHCGIEGLIRPPGVDRTDYRELLDDLASASTIARRPS